jgi:hypothetical protein
MADRKEKKRISFNVLLDIQVGKERWQKGYAMPGI